MTLNRKTLSRIIYKLYNKILIYMHKLSLGLLSKLSCLFCKRKRYVSKVFPLEMIGEQSQTFGTDFLKIPETLSRQ